MISLLKVQRMLKLRSNQKFLFYVFRISFLFSFVALVGFFLFLFQKKIMPDKVSNFYYEGPLGLWANQELVDFTRDDSQNLKITSTAPGLISHGPYMKLARGKYRLTVDYELDTRENNGTPLLGVNVLANKAKKKIYEHIFFIWGGNVENKFEFNNHYDESNVEFSLVGLRKGITVRGMELELISNNGFALDDFISVKLVILSVFVVLLTFSFFKFLDRSKIHNLVKFLALIILTVLLAIYSHRFDAIGDEPHYLLNMLNQVENRTIDMTSLYQGNLVNQIPNINGAETHAYFSPKDGKLYSAHGYLMSFILIPSRFIFSNYLTVQQSGYILMSVIFIIQTYLFFKVVKIYFPGFKSPLLLIGIFTILSPELFFITAIYPEIIASTVFMFSLVSFRLNMPIYKIISIIFLGLLPLLGVKYLLTSIFLASVYFWINIDFKKNRFGVDLLVAPYLLLILSFFLVNYLLFGSISLKSFYSNQVNYRGISPFPFLRNFVGNFIDSRVGIFLWMPYSIFAAKSFRKIIKGSISLINKKIDIFSISILMILLHLAPHAYLGSFGGGSQPLRQFIAVMPFVFILLIPYLEKTLNKYVFVFLATISAYQLYGSIVLETVMQPLYVGSFKNLFFVNSGTLFSDLSMFLPIFRDFRFSMEDLIKSIASLLILVILLAIDDTVNRLQSFFQHKNLIKSK